MYGEIEHVRVRTKRVCVRKQGKRDKEKLVDPRTEHSKLDYIPCQAASKRGISDLDGKGEKQDHENSVFVKMNHESV